ncbi:PREDICTED: EPIDERMAL PATTERNING FACTOR-like protein 1 [Prunus mume]|uniref:Epidermal patterning factor-like protein n=1 Tax=Prunus mume TaxID=102107 RepID=A0ABM0P4C6_PRUMU|nr:PREDICTED: EPIDERMAL PATTERNING FACTOR-like protein 1 [Prunus mume]
MCIFTAMNNPLYLLFKATRAIMLLHFLLLSPASCFSTHSLRGLLFEEKTRLGSTPPSCHSKCNQCHPCMAVQVPTIPSHDRVETGMTRSFPMMFFDPSHPGTNNKYSNYKPLGWKCHCGDHFFNP